MSIVLVPLGILALLMIMYQLKQIKMRVCPRCKSSFGKAVDVSRVDNGDGFSSVTVTGNCMVKILTHTKEPMLDADGNYNLGTDSKVYICRKCDCHWEI